MAYITQYEVDKKQDAANSSLAQGIGEIGQMLGENRRRAVNERRAIEELELKKGQAKKDELLFNNRLELDDLQKQEKAYGLEELKKPIEQRDDYKTKVAAAQASSGVMMNRLNAQEQNRIEAEQRAIENDKTKALNKANIPGYEVADPNIIPTAKDAEEVKSAGIFTKNFSDSGNSAIKRIETLDWKDLTGLTNNWTQLQQDVTDMQMAAKNMYDLGVLNGPDLSLVNKGLGSLSVVELNRLGPQAAMERVRNTIASAQGKLQNAANARGYKPKAPAAPDLSKMSREEKLRILNGN